MASCCCVLEHRVYHTLIHTHSFVTPVILRHNWLKSGRSLTRTSLNG